MKWTTDRENLLRKHYSDETQDELERLLPDYSYYSIQRKANTLHLKKSKIWWDKYNRLRREGSLKIKGVKEMDIKRAKEKELLEEISRRGFMSTKRDIKQDLLYPIEIGQRERIGVVSDTHIGSCYQQLTHLRRFYQYCQKLGIKKIFHAGDVVEGNGRLFKGQIYEMFLHGADAQVKYVIDNYPKAKIQTYMIGGSHDYSFYKESGDDILAKIGEKRKDLTYLGMNGAFFKLKNIVIYLMHGDGGIAYARSYKIQKICEAIAPEHKPNILLLGHYHVPCWLPGYRNIEGLQLPCFQSQTPYLKAKGHYPFIGGMIIEFSSDSKGLTSFKPEIIPFYRVIGGDY